MNVSLDVEEGKAERLLPWRGLGERWGGSVSTEGVIYPGGPSKNAATGDRDASRLFNAVASRLLNAVASHVIASSAAARAPRSY